jgi:hypothetical protein
MKAEARKRLKIRLQKKSSEGKLERTPRQEERDQSVAGLREFRVKKGMPVLASGGEKGEKLSEKDFFCLTPLLISSNHTRTLPNDYCTFKRGITNVLPR